MHPVTPGEGPPGYPAEVGDRHLDQRLLGAQPDVEHRDVAEIGDLLDGAPGGVAPGIGGRLLGNLDLPGPKPDPAGGPDRHPGLLPDPHRPAQAGPPTPPAAPAPRPPPALRKVPPTH